MATLENNISNTSDAFPDGGLTRNRRMHLYYFVIAYYILMIADAYFALKINNLHKNDADRLLLHLLNAGTISLGDYSVLISRPSGLAYYFLLFSFFILWHSYCRFSVLLIKGREYERSEIVFTSSIIVFSTLISLLCLFSMR